MGRYNFQSPGAEAGNAIQQFLIQRELDQRRQMLADIADKRQVEDSQRADAQIKLQQDQESRIAASQKQQQADLENERQFRRASTIATKGLPGVIDQGTADLLKGEGYGTLVNEQPGQPEQPFTEDPSITLPATPGVMQFAGGSEYQQARSAEQGRAAQAREAAAAAAERAGEANATRESIAAMSNQGRSETTALRNDLLKQQIDVGNDKRTEKAAADKRAKDAAKVTSGATIDVLKELADFDANGVAKLKPATGNLFGMRNPLAQYVPGSGTATARAAMDRLKGRVIVDLLNEMKNQSRTGATGFGALSGPELRLLENAASQLNNPNISDARAAEELSRIYQLANQLYGGTGDTTQTNAAPAGVVKWGRDANGRPVRIQ